MSEPVGLPGGEIRSTNLRNKAEGVSTACHADL